MSGLLAVGQGEAGEREHYAAPIVPDRPLLVVDGPSLLYRAFFALPDSIKDGDGHPVNALLGLANVLLFVHEKYRPRATVLCFGEEAAKYRVDGFANYHADRPPVPDDLQHQWDQIGDFFGAFGFEFAHAEGLEADDLLGSYATVETQAGGRALLLTGDRDMFQCATDDVTVLYPAGRGGGNDGPLEIGPKEVVERYGVTPEQVPDFIALRGDPSDGLPGAKGIGEKTAAELLRKYGTLEATIEAAIGERPGVRKALLDDPDMLRTFLDIATLRHVDVERPPDAEVDGERAALAARARGMNRLAERLDQLA
jgi:DNA polymerase-1